MDKNLKEIDKLQTTPKSPDLSKTGSGLRIGCKNFKEDTMGTNTDESLFTKDISKTSFVKKTSKKPQTWSEADTNTFYRCLEIFGMDFAMIAEVLSSKTQRQILRKFKKEQKREPEKIETALARHKSNLIERDIRTKTFLDAMFKQTSESEISDHNNSDDSLDDVINKKLELLCEFTPKENEEPIEPLEYYLKQLD